jgi:SAM-dependent methyltransferase
VTPTSPDPDSLLYAEYWEPVLVAPSGRLLDRVGERLGGRAPRSVLDVGSGTGSLALAAAERWPVASIVGLDASAGMLSVARHRVGARWPGRDGDRFRWHAADAAEIPLGEAGIDLAISSFVLQLVDDRRAVLREIGRVLRPDGLLGFVTWLRDDTWMAPDVEFDEAVYDLELEDPEADARGPEQEYESPDEAAADLATTGFTAVEVRLDTLEFSWQRTDYRAFKEQYDERDLLDSLSAADRARLLARVDERWAALPDDAFVLRAPLVSATARRPG